MNKLIKFISLVAILASNFSLSAMERNRLREDSDSSVSENAYAGDLEDFDGCIDLESSDSDGYEVDGFDGWEISDFCECTLVDDFYPIKISYWDSFGEHADYVMPDQFLVNCYMNDNFTINPGRIAIIEENIIGYKYKETLNLIRSQEEQIKALDLAWSQPITVEFLERNKLINVVFANALTCKNNSEMIKYLTSKYVPEFKDDPEAYENCAKYIIQNINAKDKDDFRFLVSYLNQFIATFFKKPFYSDAFLYSLTIVFKCKAYPFDERIGFVSGEKYHVLFEVIKFLVKDVVSKSQKSTLTNNDIIASVMCESSELLRAINKKLAK
jgi:hypothetical protein